MTRLIRFVTVYAKFEIAAGIVLAAIIAGYALCTATHRQTGSHVSEAIPALQR